MAWLPATAVASLHTISLWFIWTLNLASLQPAIGPLGWDNWFCISHQKGWNNIQDGWDDRDIANLPAAPHFDLCRLLNVGQRARVYLLSHTHLLKNQLTASKPELSTVTTSILQRAEHAALASGSTTPQLCLLWQTLPSLRKHHFVIQHTQHAQFHPAQCTKASAWITASSIAEMP